MKRGWRDWICQVVKCNCAILDFISRWRRNAFVQFEPRSLSSFFLFLLLSLLHLSLSCQFPLLARSVAPGLHQFYPGMEREIESAQIRWNNLHPYKQLPRCSLSIQIALGGVVTSLWRNILVVYPSGTSAQSTCLFALSRKIFLGHQLQMSGIQTSWGFQSSIESLFWIKFHYKTGACRYVVKKNIEKETTWVLKYFLAFFPEPRLVR